MTHSEGVGDAMAGFEDGFRERLGALFERHKDDLGQLEYEVARQFGREGAAAAVAPVLWRVVIGETWDTRSTTEFMKISRQALHQRVKNWTILALPGRGTRHFPIWQFDTGRRDVWPVIPKILAVFSEAEIEDPFVVASWASSRQPELDTSPEAWIVSGKDPDKVLEVAERTAQDLAA